MSDSTFAHTPPPPYYAVIFTSRRTAEDHGYSAMAETMVSLARTMPGFLGVESVRDADGCGITVSYWASEDAIRSWRLHIDHLAVQDAGKASWYAHYEVRVARVERAYGSA